MFDEITPQQIVKVIKKLNYDTEKIVCDDIEQIAFLLKDPELCYEMAANIDWINKELMANIVLESKIPDYNYYFASEVDGANIEKHVQVILNNNFSDEYILNCAKNLIRKKKKKK